MSRDELGNLREDADILSEGYMKREKFKKRSVYRYCEKTG